jgi:RNA polymerase sigma-54 factor
MQELAESLDIHPSTISRAVAGKYVETDWGIFRLRDFFEAGVPTTSGEGATRAGLREAIRECFASEDPCQVLDDGDVVRMLRAKGYVIARRTVAKYRVELGIPSSWHRARARSAPAAVMA